MLTSAAHSKLGRIQRRLAWRMTCKFMKFSMLKKKKKKENTMTKESHPPKQDKYKPRHKLNKQKEPQEEPLGRRRGRGRRTGRGGGRGEDGVNNQTSGKSENENSENWRGSIFLDGKTWQKRQCSWGQEQGERPPLNHGFPGRTPESRRALMTPGKYRAMKPPGTT